METARIPGAGDRPACDAAGLDFGGPALASRAGLFIGIGVGAAGAGRTGNQSILVIGHFVMQTNDQCASGDAVVGGAREVRPGERRTGACSQTVTPRANCKSVECRPSALSCRRRLWARQRHRYGTINDGLWAHRGADDGARARVGAGAHGSGGACSKRVRMEVEKRLAERRLAVDGVDGGRTRRTVLRKKAVGLFSSDSVSGMAMRFWTALEGFMQAGEMWLKLGKKPSRTGSRIRQLPACEPVPVPVLFAEEYQ